MPVVCPAANSNKADMYLAPCILKGFYTLYMAESLTQNGHVPISESTGKNCSALLNASKLQISYIYKAFQNPELVKLYSFSLSQVST